MNIVGIIPARFASTRFPGKPLIEIQGKSMIRRVYEQALKAESLSKVVVATDDERIADEVRGFGGAFVMTAGTHQSGTDRCAEVSKHFPDLTSSSISRVMNHLSIPNKLICWYLVLNRKMSSWQH